MALFLGTKYNMACNKYFQSFRVFIVGDKQTRQW
jgi:hypothetical protein